MIDLKAFTLLKSAFRFARVVKRKRDQAITRAYLLATPNEVGKRITAAPTITKVLPTTWTHTESLAKGL